MLSDVTHFMKRLLVSFFSTISPFLILCFLCCNSNDANAGWFGAPVYRNDLVSNCITGLLVTDTKNWGGEGYSTCTLSRTALLSLCKNPVCLLVVIPLMAGITAGIEDSSSLCTTDTHPMPLTDSQIKSLLVQMGNARPSVREVLDKYDKVCIKYNSEMFWIASEECKRVAGVLFCGWNPVWAQESKDFVCVDIVSTCPCIGTPGGSSLDEAQFVTKDGVIQQNEDGSPKIINEASFHKYFARHCNMLRSVETAPLMNFEYVGVFDDSCNTWKGASKMNMSFTGGPIQCVLGTMRNIFEKPLPTIESEYINLGSESNSVVASFDSDQSYVQGVIKIGSDLISKARTVTLSGDPQMSDFRSGIDAIINLSAFVSVHKNDYNADSFLISVPQSSTLTSNSVSLEMVNDRLNGLAKLSSTIALREQLFVTAIKSNQRRNSGLTVFQSLQSGAKILTSMMIVLYLVMLGSKVIMDSEKITLTTLLGHTMRIAMVIYFSLGDAWREFFFRIIFDSSFGVAQIVFDATLSGTARSDTCDFGALYYKVDSPDEVCLFPNLAMGGSIKPFTVGNKRDPGSQSIKQAMEYDMRFVEKVMGDEKELILAYELGSSNISSDPLLTEVKNYITNIKSRSNFVSAHSGKYDVSLITDLAVSSSDVENIGNLNKSWNQLRVLRDDIMKMKDSSTVQYACMKGQFLYPLNLSRVYKPSVYQITGDYGLILHSYFKMFCVMDKNNSTKEANVIMDDVTGLPILFTCDPGYTMEEGYRKSEFVRAGLDVSSIESDFSPIISDPGEEILKTAMFITDDIGQPQNLFPPEISIDMSKEKIARVKIIQKVGAIITNENQTHRLYPVEVKYGVRRSKQYVSMFDKIDCKVIEYVGITSVGGFKFLSGLDAFTIFFGGIVVLLMFAMYIWFGISLFSMIIHMLQAYLVGMIGCTVLAYGTAVFGWCSLFQFTRRFSIDYVNKMIKYAGYPVILSMVIGFSFVVADFMFYGSPAVFGEKFMFTPDGQIDGLNCWANDSLWDTPLGCLLAKLPYHSKRRVVLGIITSVPGSTVPGMADLAIATAFRLLIFCLVIYILIPIIKQIQMMFASAMEMDADVSLGGSPFNDSTGAEFQRQLVGTVSSFIKKGTQGSASSPSESASAGSSSQASRASGAGVGAGGSSVRKSSSSAGSKKIPSGGGKGVDKKSEDVKDKVESKDKEEVKSGETKEESDAKEDTKATEEEAKVSEIEDTKATEEEAKVSEIEDTKATEEEAKVSEIEDTKAIEEEGSSSAKGGGFESSNDSSQLGFPPESKQTDSSAQVKQDSKSSTGSSSSTVRKKPKPVSSRYREGLDQDGGYDYLKRGNAYAAHIARMKKNKK